MIKLRRTSLFCTTRNIPLVLEQGCGLALCVSWAWRRRGSSNGCEWWGNAWRGVTWVVVGESPSPTTSSLLSYLVRFYTSISHFDFFPFMSTPISCHVYSSKPNPYMFVCWSSSPVLQSENFLIKCLVLFLEFSLLVFFHHRIAILDTWLSTCS